MAPGSLVDRPDERLSLVDRVVLSERMADELVVHQDALQIRMSVEADAEHVPDLPLEPVRTGPHRRQGIDLRIRFFDRDLDSQPMLEGQGKQMADDHKARRRWRAGP